MALVESREILIGLLCTFHSCCVWCTKAVNMEFNKASLFKSSLEACGGAIKKIRVEITLTPISQNICLACREGKWIWISLSLLSLKIVVWKMIKIPCRSLVVKMDYIEKSIWFNYDALLIYCLSFTTTTAFYKSDWLFLQCEMLLVVAKGKLNFWIIFIFWCTIYPKTKYCNPFFMWPNFSIFYFFGKTSHYNH